MPAPAKTSPSPAARALAATRAARKTAGKAASGTASTTAPANPSALDVVQAIKEGLRRGDLVPGQRLVEPDVMRSTGASRGRVREALLRLSSEGLVELHEFKGASVKRLTRAEVLQAYQMREMIEGLAARLCAQSGLDRAARAELKTLQKELDGAASALSSDRFMRANDRYHRFILDRSGNAYVQAFVERLRLPIFRLQFQLFFEADAIGRSNADHQAITAAILEGDGDRAESAMRAHVRSGYATVDELPDSHFA